MPLEFILLLCAFRRILVISFHLRAHGLPSHRFLAPKECHVWVSSCGGGLKYSQKMVVSSRDVHASTAALVGVSCHARNYCTISSQLCKTDDYFSPTVVRIASYSTTGAQPVEMRLPQEHQLNFSICFDSSTVSSSATESVRFWRVSQSTGNCLQCLEIRGISLASYSKRALKKIRQRFSQQGFLEDLVLEQESKEASLKPEKRK